MAVIEHCALNIYSPHVADLPIRRFKLYFK